MSVSAEALENDRFHTIEDQLPDPGPGVQHPERTDWHPFGDPTHPYTISVAAGVAITEAGTN